MAVTFDFSVPDIRCRFAPNDMVILSPREAFICADGGEILRLTDIVRGADSLGLVTTNNLTRINAKGDVIVAAGASATVVRSLNRGKTFSITTTNPGAAALTTVEVMDRNRIWVANGAGAGYYTMNGGEMAWIAASLPGTPTSIQDIVAATDEVLFMSYVEGGVARLASSMNGGQSWVRSADVNPRLSGLPSTGPQRFNRIAVPQVGGKNDINANNILLAGLGVGTDGTLYQGAPNVF